MSPEALRAHSFGVLDSLGFRPARWLPLREAPFVLRPLTEVARRLMALDALFTWVAFPEEAAGTERVQHYIQANDLSAALTGEEQAILSLTRPEAQEAHGDVIGWRLENMWPLAWALGFEPQPDLAPAFIPDEVTRTLLHGFLPGLSSTVEVLLKQSRPRDAGTVAGLEDLFYCAHNAVRSAQLGGQTVPPGFHPVLHGGAVHERRHALTWLLSPEVAWDDTDLAT